jgi:hypothetical protein
MEVTKMLTLSTAHITEQTARALDNEPDSDKLNLCVYPKSEFGWYIAITDNIDEIINDKGMPEDLADAIRLTKDLDCKTLCFDCDCEPLSYLKTYSW